MKIEDYSFGRIKISGKVYTSDVIVFPDRVLSNWWRIEGHKLHIKDLDEVIKYKPEILVIGTGAYGAMKVPNDVIEELNRLGIKTEVYVTEKAVKKFNEYISGGKRVSAALHLTC